MTKAINYDAKIWLQQIKERGIKTFVFTDLPEELKNRKCLKNAQAVSAIRKVGRVQHINKNSLVARWEVVW